MMGSNVIALMLGLLSVDGFCRRRVSDLNAFLFLSLLHIGDFLRGRSKAPECFSSV